jgi:UDP-glucose 4-epimerase
MAKTVVFGGAGFLGSHVADALTAHGHDVTIFDVVESKFRMPNQEMVVGDILDDKLVDQTIAGAKYVYHFAGIADIGEASRRPIDCVNSNILGTTKILQASVTHGVERFMLASTVYVNSKHGGFYKASKIGAEAMVEAYADGFNLPYTILRYGSLYGPRAQEWNGIARYVRQGLTDKKILISGTGEERRDFIHVYDAARLSVKILENEFKNHRVTITGTQTLSYSELGAMIAEILGNEVTVRFQASKAANHYNVTPYNFMGYNVRKLVADSFIDIGQGLLDVIQDQFALTQQNDPSSSHK